MCVCVCLASSRHNHMAASSLDSNLDTQPVLRDILGIFRSIRSPSSILHTLTARPAPPPPAPTPHAPSPPSPFTRTTTAPPPTRAEPPHTHTHTTTTATTSRRDYRRRKNTILQSVLEVIGNHSDSAKLYWKVRVMLLKTVRVLLIYKDLYSHLYHELY
jgi:hypothetical protein